MNTIRFCTTIVLVLMISVTGASANHENESGGSPGPPHFITGHVAFTGVLEEDELLTADLSDLEDDDGFGEFVDWEWAYVTDTSYLAIPGATSNTYTLTQQEVGHRMGLEVTHRDPQLGDRRIVSFIPRETVGNVNDPPTGEVTIDGILRENEELMANTSSLADEDGLVGEDGMHVGFFYRWNTRDGNTDTPIPGATLRTYTLTQAEVGKSITVTVDYVDRWTTLESVTSAATAVVRGSTEPVADAGPDQRTVKGTTVTLDGSLSSVPSGDALAYSWTHTNAGITLNGANTASPSFTVPADLVGDLMGEGNLTFILTVTDTGGVESTPDSVDILIRPLFRSTVNDQAYTENVEIANLGLPDARGRGKTYSLIREGSLSDLPGGLTFNASTRTLSGTPDEIGVFNLIYTVTDSDGGTDSLRFRITVINAAPTADAGPDQRVGKGTEVTLDGTGSTTSPPGRTLTYAWTQTRGTTVSLNSPTAAQPTFTVPNVIPTTDPSSLDFSLVVTDGQVSSSNEETVRIFVRPLFRTTIANQTYSEDTAIDNLILPTALERPGDTNTYGLASVPAGLSFDPAARTLSGTPTIPGTFDLTYTATDQDSRTDSLEFSVTVSNANDPPIGVPTINGTATQGEALTVDTTGISDADGPSALDFSYQWLADGSNISGATSATYTLTQNEVGQMITVTVSYTDAGSTDESLTSAAVGPVSNANDPPTGSVTISGTATQGEALTVDTTGISDADGPSALDFSYQWLADGSNISGATSATYTLTQNEVGQMITVTVSYTDAGSTDESLTSAAVGPVSNANDPPIGVPTINGTATQGEALTVDTTGISDADGPSALDFSYQWLADGSNISGATSATYTLTQNEVGQMITVTVSYTDAGSTDESLTSAAVGPVSNANDPPIGVPTINGTATQGEALTVDTTGISDADGPSALDFSYQWLADGSNISGATSATYTLTQNEVGQMITVTVSYTDAGSTDESLTSAAVGPVSNANDPPTGSVTISGTATQGEALTVDTTGISDADGPSALDFSYQWLADGSNISGATSATYTLTQNEVGQMITVTVSYTDAGSTDESLTSAAVGPVSNANDPPTGSVTISGTATQGEALTVDTTGISDADGPSALDFSYQWLADGSNISGATSATYTLTQNEVGQMITVTVSYTDAGSTDESLTSAAVGPVSNANDPPTGSVTISGTATQGEALTVDTTGISDADGPSALDFSYQWLADGSNISGATSATYTLTQNEVGQMITVTVSYTDAGSTDESLTSAAVGPVSNANDPPTGSVTISGTATQGEALTVDTTGISDADGPDTLTFSYQWLADGSNISGATSATYTLTQNEVGQMITVTVSYTDAGSTDESLTSAAVGPVSNANDPPIGVPTINGTPTQGETLTVDTTGISDADGPSTLDFSYQWLADGSNIDGANSETYTLTQSEVGQNISVTVTYTDDGSTNESLTSAAVGPVTNANDPPIGVPTINGTATQGETLTVDTTGISDADGPSTLDFSYQWLADGSNISGATSATYTLTQNEVGQMITVTVSYTDAGSTDESLTSAAVGPVSNANDPPTGSVTISGTATQGEALTVDTTGISDADGPSALDFSYQWLADGSNISGATSATYTLTQNEVGQMITVTVSYTDAGSTDESLTSAAVGPVTNANDPPIGVPTINGTATQGETLTVDTTGISDADGPSTLDFSYQWLADGSNIDGANSDSYTLTQSEVGQNISVTVSYTDAGGTNESLTSAAVGPVSNANDSPTGVPVINGTPTQGAELTADTTGISDPDGPDTLTFSHQWLADGNNIDGANSETYTLTQSEVGQNISVTVTYTDDGSTNESLTSAAVGPVTNANDPPIGVPTINGTATQGETLTVDTTGISDADGPDTLTFSYQWLADGNNIDGANSETYTLTQSEVGQNISVTVTYTDDGSTNESLTSAAVGPVTNANDPPIGVPTINGTATQGETLTVDTTGISDADGPDTLTFSYQWLADGNNIDGANSETYTLTQSEVGQNISVTVTYTDDGSTNESLTSAAVGPVTNANDPPIGVPTINGTATQGETLTVDTTGISDADGPSTLDFSYQWLADGSNIDGANSDSYTLTQSEVGQNISVTVTYTDAGGTNESLTSDTVGPVTNANDPPIGVPTINGTATQGETLTVDTTGISDADGPSTLDFSYQWLADGSNIDGANSDSYTLTQSEVGQNISVTVTYTDAGSTNETLTSDTVGPVTNTNDSPIGVPVINGTATQGETLTVDTTGISDPDGPDTLTFSHQWLADGNNIDGANSETYTLTQSEVGQSISVTVTYTDAGGTNESLTSATVGPVTNTNDSPTGVPVINGTPTQGAELTADTTGISDPDGPDTLTFSHQWLADGNNIDGATSDSYTLTQSEVGQNISVTVTYTDAGSTNETLTSATVGPVTNANDPPIGVPTINGTATQGETLTVDTTGISDPDGPDTLTFSHQWLADGNNIDGATSDSYTLTQSEVGQNISVTVTYTDAGSTNETLTSDTVGPVTNTKNNNDAPVAVATATPNPAIEGDTVTLNGSASSDPNGNDADLTYLWEQTSESDISLSSTMAISPTFTAPIRQTADDAELVFTLTVTDSTGLYSIDTVTITVTADVSVQKTVETVNRFMDTRTRLILANQPNALRRINRLQRDAGAEELSFATGEINKLIPFEFELSSLGTGNYNFATSLDQVTRAAKHLQMIQGETATHERRRFDVWAEGSFYKFNGSAGSEGDFALIYLGTDYLASPNLLVGGVLQYDQLSDSNGSSDIEGKGWMAGPYVTARLKENLYVDARVAGGTSDNEVTPVGTYTDSFTSTRWLADISLSGVFTQGQWTLQPNAALSYLADRQSAYTNTLGVTIPGQTVSQGQFKVGPTVSRQFLGGNGWRYEPKITLDAIYSHANISGVSLTTARQEYAWRARVAHELSITSPGGIGLSLTGIYDGIGQREFEAWGLRLNLNMKF